MRLPIGYDNFQEIIEKKFDYIDKTLLIKELLDDDVTKVAVITRPRRFGKTLNLSMLHHFFAATAYGKKTHDLFQNLNISRCGSEYMQHQGKFPVIFITFKDIKESNYAAACRHLVKLMSRLYHEHLAVLNSMALSQQQKDKFQAILEERAEEASLQTALLDLTQFLYLHYGTKPWLLIDEYDTPIQSGYLHDYYDDIIAVMRGIFSTALKGNVYLERAVITGILRVAKESLFSGVNNLKVYSLLSNQYSEYFGFTEPEMDAILKQSQLSDHAAAIKQWYNGYTIGSTTIYNPWSIVNCIYEKGVLKPYWVNTSDNQLIKVLLKSSPLTFKTQFEALMRGQSTEQPIDENMVFTDLQGNPLAAWSLMLMSGYLTITNCEQRWDGTWCQLRVPNQEVNNLYRTIVGMWLANGNGLGWYVQFTTTLALGNMEKFSADLEEIMLQIASYHDFAREPEAFFHGLLLGFIASLQESHDIKSNRESGLGRYDIMLIPRDNKHQLGIVIELKAKASNDLTSLDALAEMALEQINQKHYAAECSARKITQMLKIAIAFSGKSFAMRYEKTPS